MTFREFKEHIEKKYPEGNYEYEKKKNYYTAENTERWITFNSYTKEYREHDMIAFYNFLLGRA